MSEENCEAEVVDTGCNAEAGGWQMTSHIHPFDNDNFNELLNHV
jgi:hypothetical protein